MSNSGRLPIISAKRTLSAEKRYAGEDTRSQPKSWVNASIKGYWDFSSQRTTKDEDFRTYREFVDISYVVAIVLNFEERKAKDPKDPKDVMHTGTEIFKKKKKKKTWCSSGPPAEGLGALLQSLPAGAGARKQGRARRGGSWR